MIVRVYTSISCRFNVCEDLATAQGQPKGCENVRGVFNNSIGELLSSHVVIVIIGDRCLMHPCVQSIVRSLIHPSFTLSQEWSAPPSHWPLLWR